MIIEGRLFYIVVFDSCWPAGHELSSESFMGLELGY